MLTVFIILLIIVSIALGLFVLIQNPKGGGLATGGAGNSMFGVQRTGDVLEKGTWVLIAIIVVISITITSMSKSGVGAAKSKIQEQVDKSAIPSVIGGGNNNGTSPAATPKQEAPKKK